MPDAHERADKILEEKCTDYMLEMDFFVQEFWTWSQQLDKLLVTGAAAGFARRATYEKESAELRKTHRR